MLFEGDLGSGGSWNLRFVILGRSLIRIFDFVYAFGESGNLFLQDLCFLLQNDIFLQICIDTNGFTHILWILRFIRVPYFNDYMNCQ